MNDSPKILVFGADGFIGTHFSKRCESENMPFLKYTRQKEKANVSGYVYGSLDEIIQLHPSIEILVNLSGNKRDEQTMQEDNVEWVKKLILIAEKKSLQILHLGSAGIYGIAQQQIPVINESSDPIISNVYEQTKLEADQALHHSKIKFCVVRPTNVFGEYDKESKLLNLMKQLQQGRFFFLNKKAMTNYVYAGYVAETLLRIIKHNRFQREVFNINQATTIEEFVSTICKALQIENSPRTLPRWFHPAVQFYSQLSKILPKRMRWVTPSKYRELTSEIQISSSALQSVFPELNASLHDGISNLVAWYKAQKRI